MTAGKWRCPWCRAVVRAGRKVTLDQAIDHHEESCPMAPAKAKTP